MEKRKGIFLFSIITIFIFSLNFKQNKPTKSDNLDLRQEKIQCLNSGRLFRLKEGSFAPGQLLVKFKPAVSTQGIRDTLEAYHSWVIRHIPRLDIYQIRIPEGYSVEEMIYVLSQNPDVEYAEPNYLASIAATPNDALFRYQYALHNTGQSIGIPGSPQGKDRADIRATAAWEETKGDEAVVVAVIDTGVDLLHPDLKAKVLSGGRDFVNGDFDATDDNGHGTHVAGIIAAHTNNDEGIAGVAWNCKILPVKALDLDGSGYYSWLIEATVWAADNGAAVINFSIGGDASAQALEDALKYAFQKGVVIAAASGNDSTAVLYPAGYDKYVLAVAATDYNDNRTEWSNFGPEVDIAAPGERVLSCVPTWYFGPGSLPYAFGYGTSMSVAHVSGLAALIKNIKPWLKASEIMDVIRYTADDVNKSSHPGYDKYVGYGRINMEKALVPIKIESSGQK